MPEVYKVAMVRMFRKELTNLRMYGSKGLSCRNAVGEKSWQERCSKNCLYETPYCVTGAINPAGSKQKPKAICTDRVIGTRKGVEV